MEKNLKNAINIFCQALIKNGVSEETVKSSLADVVPLLKSISEIIQSGLSDTDFLAGEKGAENRAQSNKRSDFLGRAMLQGLERFLPSNREEEEEILERPVPGKVPRQVFQGIINAVKSAHGYATVDEYENICSEKVKLYSNASDGTVDISAFAEDPEVKSIIDKMMGKMTEAFQSLDEDTRREWFTNVISNSRSFLNGMAREVDSEEYDLLVRELFKEVPADNAGSG